MPNKLHCISVFAFIYFSFFAAFAQKRYTVKVNDFTILDVDNSIAVDYHCNPDSAGLIIIDFTDNPDNFYFSYNSKGKLTIRTSADYAPGTPLPRIIAYSTKLTKITNCGDSLVKVFDIPPTEEFTARLIGNGHLVAHGIEASKVNASIDSGNGQLVISGECTNANLRNVGTGVIQADGLKSTNVKASILGTGDIGCDPKEILTIMGVGSGTVYYRNKPAKLKTRGVGLKHSQLSENADGKEE